MARILRRPDFSWSLPAVGHEGCFQADRLCHHKHVPEATCQRAPRLRILANRKRGGPSFSRAWLPHSIATVGPGASSLGITVGCGYWLGLLVYRMLTGTLPFSGENADSRNAQAPSTTSDVPCKYVQGLDPQWERVILKCLSTDPWQCFSSVREVVTALDR